MGREKMSARTVEIFLTCCLEGEAGVITRILKKNKKTWTGKISSSSFNINCIDSSNRGGLMLACIKNCKEVVDLLLSRGDLDVNMVDIFGATCLMYASQHSDGKEVVKLLLERKDIDLDETDQDGKTAEDFAAVEGNLNILQTIREERSKRMGSVWTRLETTMGEDDSETEDSLEDMWKQEPEIKPSNEEIFLFKDDEPDIPNDDDLFVKTEVIEKINEKIEKERKEIADKEWQYMEEILQIEGNFQDETVKIEKMMGQKMKNLEASFLKKKLSLQDEFTKQKEKSECLISKLETAKVNLDMAKLLQPARSISELECPVCLEEMRPPVRIWQCVSGHAVCEGCRKSPLVRDCPTCRQKIVGGNILAEKLARSLYPGLEGENK